MGKIVLAFDAGHGGGDCGAYNKNLGQNEKTWTRKTVDKVKAIMEATGKFTIIDCRPGDTNPSLYQRALNAKNGGAVYMCSFHLNAFNTKAYGQEIIAPAAESEAATEVAFKQAISDEFGFTWRKYFCKDLNTGATHTKGVSGVKFTNVYSFTDWYGIPRNAWQLGISADICEMAFIDNDADMTKFMNNHDAICKSIAKKLAAAYGVSIDGEISIPETKPVEPAKPETPSGSDTYKVVTNLTGYWTAAEAKAGKASGPAGTVTPGTYYVFNESQGMKNVTKSKGTPGCWINPAKNKQSSSGSSSSSSSSSTTLKKGAIVIANGQGTGNSAGGGNKTYTLKNQKVKIVSDLTNGRWAVATDLNGDIYDTIGWFLPSQLGGSSSSSSSSSTTLKKGAIVKASGRGTGNSAGGGGQTYSLNNQKVKIVSNLTNGRWAVATNLNGDIYDTIGWFLPSQLK